MLRRAGFTLLEVMLVLLLIGILASAVVFTFSSDSTEQRLEREATRFSQVFQFIADTALLRQQEWGLVVSQQQYAFVYYGQDGWQWAPEVAAAKAYQLPEQLSLLLELEGLPGAEFNLLGQVSWQQEAEDEASDTPAANKPPLPQVFILSSGEITPFRLVLQAAEQRPPVQVRVGTDFSVPLSRFSGAE